MECDTDDAVRRYYEHHLSAYEELCSKVSELESEIAMDEGAKVANKEHYSSAIYFEIPPIGVVHNTQRRRFEAAREPFLGSCADSFSELVLYEDLVVAPGYYFFEFHFNRNYTYRQLVLPPRQQRRVGLYSSRTPHRLNPIGLSLGEVTGVVGRAITVRGLDLLDGTPVLSLHAYEEEFDHSEAHCGWLAEDTLIDLYYDDAGQKQNLRAARELENIDTFNEKIAFISASSCINFADFLTRELQNVPVMTRTHKEIKGGVVKVLGFGLFRVKYQAFASSIRILDVYCAVTKELALKEVQVDPEMQIALEFYEKFG